MFPSLVYRWRNCGLEQARDRIAKVWLASASAFADLILQVIAAPFGIMRTVTLSASLPLKVVRSHDIRSRNGCVLKIVVNSLHVSAAVINRNCQHHPDSVLDCGTISCQKWKFLHNHSHKGRLEVSTMRVIIVRWESNIFREVGWLATQAQPQKWARPGPRPQL